MTTRTLAQILLSTAAVALLAPSPEAATSAPAPASSPLTILTVYWSSESFPGTQTLDAIIQKGLRSRSDRIDYFAEYLESDRFPDEEPFSARVRFRTVGDMTCTGGVVSDAGTIDEVVNEIAATRVTERGETRADDRVSEAAMEDRKRVGYF